MNEVSKKNSLKALLGGILLVACLSGCSRFILEGDRKNRDIRIRNPYRGTVTIPFEMINNLIVIPMRINNSDTLKFILDTGAGRTVITELGPYQSFEIEYQGDVSLNGLGNSGPLPALISRGNRIYLKGIKGENHTVVFILEGRFNLSNFMGTQVNGLLGYDIFENFIVEVDYERRKLYLHDPDAYKEEYLKRKKEAKWTYIPVFTKDNKLYMNLKIIQSDFSEIEVKLLVDSGASHTAFLYPNTSADIVIPEKTIDAYLGSGLSGEIYGKIGKAHSIELQGLVLNDPVLSYPDLEAVEQAIERDSRNGSIGADLLKRFDIIYNYGDNGILVRPNRNFDDEFRYNTSGIDVITPILDLPYYVVSEVRSGSPADLTGIKKDDVILEIQSNRAFKYTLNEVLNLLHSTDEEISIFIKRGSEHFRFDLNLKDELKLQ
ncbi:MAG: aspartyl protease family protein [Balneola sp.]|nr:aspartyl protease family protein [Balneola sp.]MBO6651025.1 aspartyl protease family protein [Balneola sp.]MBO6711186.1 aspartyl protease family protein [Balneola sp.]MBO6800699.1 aspartyl protease family protein [Balneola sp.]MBO6869122.1 aspartyl protease family protein [Balneola sp.]